jgi:hypothetical protein
MHLTNLKRVFKTLLKRPVSMNAPQKFPPQLTQCALTPFTTQACCSPLPLGYRPSCGEKEDENYLLFSGATRIVWCGTRVALELCC